MIRSDRRMAEPSRANRGSIVALVPAGILMAVIGIGAFALDISHNVSVRSELQSATDAAALAGAQDLISASTERNADTTALLIAAANTADGTPIDNATTKTTVTSETSPWDNSTDSGTVQVDATVSVTNMFAKLFGHNSDDVHGHSMAKCWRSVTGIRSNEGFPLMVSLDTAQGNPKPLYQMSIGDKFDIHINSQQFKNGAWTGFTTKNTNANWLKAVMDMALGFTPATPGYIPGATVGDSLELGNGVMAQKTLAEPAYESRLTDPKFTVVIPVMTGEPPYNQNRKAVGFITLHIDSVSKNKSGGEVETLHATIVKGIVKGTGGIPAAGNSAVSQGMNNISAGTVQLVQ